MASNADPLILDPDYYLLRYALSISERTYSQLDLTASGAIFDSVAEQIIYHLFDAHQVKPAHQALAGLKIFLYEVQPVHTADLTVFGNNLCERSKQIMITLFQVQPGVLQTRDIE